MSFLFYCLLARPFLFWWIHRKRSQLLLFSILSFEMGCYSHPPMGCWEIAPWICLTHLDGSSCKSTAFFLVCECAKLPYPQSEVKESSKLVADQPPPAWSEIRLPDRTPAVRCRTRTPQEEKNRWGGKKPPKWVLLLAKITLVKVTYTHSRQVIKPQG